VTKPHYLAPSGKTRTPSLVISFDTETCETMEGDHSVQVLRCWDAVIRTRRPGDERGDKREHREGERSPGLTDLIEANASRHKETWVIAHNVSFDLAVTSLPFALVEREWTLDAMHIGSDSTWWVLKRDGHKIIITDSWSWLRCSLADAAKDIGRRKVRLPDADDSLKAWHKRCRKDAEILDEIMATLMDWWDANELGVFGITGASCGWRTLRKTITPRRLLVGPDGERTDFERLAIYGGLKEVYGVGEFHDTWIADYDFVSAYVTACAAFPLPVCPMKPWTTSERLLEAGPPIGRDYLAEVEITTHRPCAPVRIGDEVWQPVGTFRAVLSGPEVRHAATVADEVRVLRHRAYRTGFALADWAAWCLSIQSASPSEVPPVVARVAKNWGRSVTGRFASRTSRIVATRASTHLGWHLETGHDLDTGAAMEWLSIGGVEQTIAKDLDANDVFPAVLAFVEGYVRVGLREMIATRDPTLVLQCNTDGWWETKATRRSDYVPENIPWPFRVVRKALERSILVVGPNHLLTPHERRFSGIPSKAIKGNDGKMKWRDWPGLRWQLEHGRVGEYHRPEREAELSTHYVRRWVLDSGETIPVTMTVDDEGVTRIEPWQRSWGQRDDDVLALYQVPTLQSILDSDTTIDDVELDDLPPQPGRDFPSMPRGGQWREPTEITGSTPTSTPLFEAS